MAEDREIETFVQNELEPLQVRATVLETADLALKIDGIRRLKAGDFYGPRLGLKQRSLAVVELKVTAAGTPGPIILGTVEIVTYGEGCQLSFYWRGGPETFDTARILYKELARRFAEQRLLGGSERRGLEEIPQLDQRIAELERVAVPPIPSPPPWNPVFDWWYRYGKDEGMKLNALAWKLGYSPGTVYNQHPVYKARHGTAPIHEAADRSCELL